MDTNAVVIPQNATTDTDVQNSVDDNDVDMEEQFEEEVSLHNLIDLISALSKRHLKIEF